MSEHGDWQELLASGPALDALNLRLEAMSAEQRMEWAAGRFGDERSRVGDRLALVASDRVFLVPIGEFQSAAPQSTPKLDEPGIRGRVLVTGDKLAIPTSTGVQIVDPAKPSAPSRKSRIGSATFLFSAAVLTTTPKFFGRMDSISLNSLSRSSVEPIFLEMAMVLLNGVSTINLPGTVISHESRWPLVEMGSLTICTRSKCFFSRTWETFPFLLISS